MFPPAKTETRAVPVGGPRHYPIQPKTCTERGWHRIRESKCQECSETGSAEWMRQQFLKEADFLLELGEAVEDLAKKQIREFGMLYDSDTGYPRTAPHRAGGNER